MDSSSVEPDIQVDLRAVRFLDFKVGFGFGSVSGKNRGFGFGFSLKIRKMLISDNGFLIVSL